MDLVINNWKGILGAYMIASLLFLILWSKVKELDKNQ